MENWTSIYGNQFLYKLKKIIAELHIIHEMHNY
jgi:hypothetical protein